MLILSLYGSINTHLFILINPITQEAVCNKRRLQTCSWQVNEVNNIVKRLNRFAIPSLIFKSFKVYFRDRESVRAFHNNVYLVYLPVCGRPWVTMTSTRLWRPVVLVKTRVWVGCSVSPSHKTWSRTFLFKDFLSY